MTLRVLLLINLLFCLGKLVCIIIQLNGNLANSIYYLQFPYILCLILCVIISNPGYVNSNNFNKIKFILLVEPILNIVYLLYHKVYISCIASNYTYLSNIYLYFKNEIGIDFSYSTVFRLAWLINLLQIVIIVFIRKKTSSPLAVP
jgi:hypothetical protein